MLPARFPNLLVNGSQGIAVGMATNIPPHNLGEVIDAVSHLLANPDATPDDLMQFVKGPDFPTGALIMGRQGIMDAYRTGRGSIKLRGKAEIEEGTRSRLHRHHRAAVPGEPEPVHRRRSRSWSTAGELEGIAELNDESAKGKTRLVVELKRDAPALVILNNLYKRTPLQTNFSVNTVALVDGIPRTLNLRDALVAYIDHQNEVIRRRSRVPPPEGQGPGPHRRGPDQGARHDRRDHRRHPGQRGPRRRPSPPSWPSRSSSPTIQAEHILDMQLVAAHPPGSGQPRGGDGRAARDHRRARGDPGRRGQAPRRHQRGDGRDPRDLRPAPSQPDHLRRRRPRHRGPHRRRGPRRHHERQGLHQDRRLRRLPGAGPRRPGRGRHQAQGRGLGQPHHPHHGPRLPAVLLEPGPGVPPQGPRDPDEGAHGAGHGDREPAAAAARRDDPGDHRHPRLRDQPVPVLRHHARARSRRPSSPSTTPRCGPGSSPSTCATTTSWCG